ncbi:MAG: tetratricopeptide repeat protein [Pirellulaceae bacterium]|nr:tetratricopeptide repeat protein [Pirellulaceae bacterium]
MSSPADVEIVAWNSTPSLRPAKIALGLAVLTALLYVNSLSAPFLFDDWLFAAEDGIIRMTWDWSSPQHMNRLFGTATLKWNFELGGNRPWGYRAFNVAVHACAGLALFGLVRRTLRLPGIPTRLTDQADWLATIIALLWLVHPLQTQSVTYIVQRYESLMGLFFLLTMYCLVRGSQSAKPRDWYLAAFTACSLGAASKEVMVVCPLVLVLFDRAFLAGTFRQVYRERGWFYASLVLPMAYIVWAEWHALAGDDATSAGFATDGVTPWEYLRSQPGVLLHYLRLSFWPDRLILDYGWPIAKSPWQIYGLGAVIVLLLGLSLWGTWKYPRLGFLGMAFFLVLAPTSSFMPIKDLAFEHRMYLPLAAVVTLVVLAVEWLLAHSRLPESPRGSVALVLVVAVAGPLALRTVIRNRDYRQPIAFWTQCIEQNPKNPRPYRILSDLYQAEGSEAALAYYQRALALNPNLYWIWIDLGNYYLRHGQPEQALPHYERATTILPREKTAYINLSRTRMLQGDFIGAVAICRQALGQIPGQQDLIKQLAWLLATADDPAVRSGTEALQLLANLPQSPKKIDIQYLEVLSAAQAEAGDFDRAIATSQQLLAEARHIRSRRLAEFEARLKLYQAHQPYRMKVEALSRPRGAQTARN